METSKLFARALPIGAALALGPSAAAYQLSDGYHRAMGDGAQVDEIDSAGLQLLILLKKEAQRAGKRLAIVAHSQAVRATIDFCHLAADFGDPLLIPVAEAS